MAGAARRRFRHLAGSRDAGAPPLGFDPWLALRALGYALDDRAAAVRAFHLRFRGMETDTLDAEDARILFALTRAPD